MKLDEEQGQVVLDEMGNAFDKYAPYFDSLIILGSYQGKDKEGETRTYFQLIERGNSYAIRGTLASYLNGEMFAEETKNE